MPCTKPTCSCSGRYVSAPRNATPAPNAATLAATELAVWVKTGAGARRSYQTKRTAGTIASGTRNAAGSQCRVTASSTATMAPSRIGPSRLSGWPASAGAGRARPRSDVAPAHATVAIIGRLIQKTQRQPTVAVRTAPSSGPTSAETPHIAALMPNARGRSASGIETAKSPSGTANMNPAPAPRIRRDSATTGIDGARPPITLATAKSEQASAKLQATPSRSITAPATGNVIATATVYAPTVTAIRPTPQMSCEIG